MRKERFPRKRRSKLALRADGPFKVLERVNDNAYKVNLPDEMGGVSTTFNIGDLLSYMEDSHLEDLRASPSQPERDDISPATSTFLDPKFLPIHHSAQANEGNEGKASCKSKEPLPSPIWPNFTFGCTLITCIQGLNEMEA